MVKYAFEDFNKENMARAFGRNLPISLKKTTETLREIRGKKVSSAKNFLKSVINQEVPVPYRRFGTEVAHRKGKGIASGGFPVSVSKTLLKLLNAAEKNASEQELGEDLFVIAASARKGTTRQHTGRNQGMMKSTNVEIIVGVKEK